MVLKGKISQPVIIYLEEPKLHSNDITTLKSPLGWLTDNHMFLANYVLKKE